MRTFRTLFIAGACLLIPAHSLATIIHVRATAPAGGNGSSWAAAHNSLQAALTASAAGDEIWVAAGTYSATTGLYAFAIKSNVALYGGFAGTESARTQRDFATNITTLSGSGQRTVVIFLNATGAVLDGFDIVQGKGHGGINSPLNPSANYCPGGGLCFENSNAIVANCKMTDNAGGLFTAGIPGTNGDGGGALLRSSTVQFNRCNFERNRVGHSVSGGCQMSQPVRYGGAGSGAGIAALASNLQLNDCFFMDNLASDGAPGAFCGLSGGVRYGEVGGSGGAVFISGGSLIIDRCIFVANRAGRGGESAIYNDGCYGGSGTPGNGGAIAGSAPLQIRNSLFVANGTFSNGPTCGVNVGGMGGAIHNVGYTALFRNCAFYGNTSPGNSATGVGTLSVAHPQIANCIFWGNTGDAGSTLAIQLGNVAPNLVTYSIVQGLETLTQGNLNVDPLFVDADGTNNTLGDADDRFDVAWGSPAIDAGSNSAILGFFTDLSGNNRNHNALHAPNTGQGSIPTDIGPYEFFRCPTDLSSAASPGQPDNAVTIDDLLYFLTSFEAGANPADLDNGAATGVHDNAVTIDDLLFFLVHFEAGC